MKLGHKLGVVLRCLPFQLNTTRKKQHTFSLHFPSSSAVIMGNNNICCFSLLFGCFRLCSLCLLKEQSLITEKFIHIFYENCYIFLPSPSLSLLVLTSFENAKRHGAKICWLLVIRPQQEVRLSAYLGFIYDTEHVTEMLSVHKKWCLFASRNCFINFHFNLKFRQRAYYFDLLRPARFSKSDNVKHQHKSGDGKKTIRWRRRSGKVP